MSSLPLELYQVLEDEYVSMYGPLERRPSTYDEKDILDAAKVCEVLVECELPANEPPAKTLSALVTGTGSLDALARSSRITDRGKQLLEHYEEASAAARAVDELRRTIVDDAFHGLVQPLRDARLDAI